MEKLLSESLERINAVDTNFKRYLFYKINWNNRLIALKGSRGTGKTTLLLQYIKQNLALDHTVLYIPLDHPYFYNNSLLDLADEFVMLGGKYLFLDEIHKYLNWSRELKLIYDRHTKLKVVFTSSSILEIYKGESDLSRRVISYNLNELSLREYVELSSGIKLQAFKFNEILERHTAISLEIQEKISPIYELNNYLKYGAYPFFVEGLKEYPQKLLATLNQILENDLPSIYRLDYHMIIKMKKLLYAISSSSPFKPNISKISQRIGVTRPTLLRFLSHLEKALVIYQLRTGNSGISLLAKPEKLYIHNTNLIKLLSPETANIGTLRETFFLNQISVDHKISYSKQSDFLVDNIFTFEIGGKNKPQKQIRELENAFIVKDNMETGALSTIPLWLFGFLY